MSKVGGVGEGRLIFMIFIYLFIVGGGVCGVLRREKKSDFN